MRKPAKDRASGGAAKAPVRSPKRHRETAPAEARRAPARAPAAGRLGKYVYCIIEAPEPLRFGAIGIGAEPADAG